VTGVLPIIPPKFAFKKPFFADRTGLILLISNPNKFTIAKMKQ
jgi:hypothetical protein